MNNDLAGPLSLVHSEFSAVLAALFWSITVILLRISGFRLDPVPLTFFKSFVAVACFLVVIPLTGLPLAPGLPWEAHARLLVSAVLGISIADTLFVAALSRLGASLQALADCIYAPAVALVGWLMFGETLNFWEVLGGALVLVGVAAGMGLSLLRPPSARTSAYPSMWRAPSAVPPSESIPSCPANPRPRHAAGSLRSSSSSSESGASHREEPSRTPCRRKGPASSSSSSSWTSPDPVNEFRRRLEEWRESRSKQRPMPEALWSEAAELAARHGVSPISLAFHLDFSRLKRRLEAIRTPASASQLSPPTFVEISMEAPRAAPARSPNCLGSSIPERPPCRRPGPPWRRR